METVIKQFNLLSEYSKLAQKVYNSIHDWMGKMIHGELCKRLRFEPTTKWYMQKPEPVQVKETLKILRYLQIQTDHLISTRKPDLVLIN